MPLPMSQCLSTFEVNIDFQRHDNIENIDSTHSYNRHMLTNRQSSNEHMCVTMLMGLFEFDEIFSPVYGVDHILHVYVGGLVCVHTVHIYFAMSIDCGFDTCLIYIYHISHRETKEKKPECVVYLGPINKIEYYTIYTYKT